MHSMSRKNVDSVRCFGRIGTTHSSTDKKSGDSHVLYFTTLPQLSFFFTQFNEPEMKCTERYWE